MKLTISYEASFILGLVLIALIYLFWYYMQPLQILKVNISQQVIKPRKILYKHFQGLYLDIKDEFGKMMLKITKVPLLEGFDKSCDDLIKEHIGIFYDNPD